MQIEEERDGRLRLMSALSNEMRVTIMEVLSEETEELTAMQISRAVQERLEGIVSLSSISQHLTVLIDASLIKKRRQGRHGYYSCKETAAFFKNLTKLCNTIAQQQDHLLQLALARN